MKIYSFGIFVIGYELKIKTMKFYRALLSVLILACFQTAILAQLNDREHMMFMKVPIDGTITEFASKMKAKGFVQTEVVKNIIIMEGEFMGKECEIALHCTSKTKTVWTVAVFFKKYYTSWHSIKSAYMDIVDSYVGKYGTPTHEFKSFSRPYYEGDGYEIQALELDKCSYSSFWMDNKDGGIEVTMTEEARIKIRYEDRFNAKKKELEDQAQINEDI